VARERDVVGVRVVPQLHLERADAQKLKGRDGEEGDLGGQVEGPFGGVGGRDLKGPRLEVLQQSAEELKPLPHVHPEGDPVHHHRALPFDVPGDPLAVQQL